MINIEENLKRKLESCAAGIRNQRSSNVFEERYYIGPEDLYVKNYIRSKPIAVFNPGALEKNGMLHVFPRLIFDYYKYTSSVGAISLDIEKVIKGKINQPIETEIILWPQHLWEFLGCEDARVSLNDDNLYMLYTGKGYFYGENNKLTRRDVLGFAEFTDTYELKRRGYFKISNGNEDFFPVSNKDSAFINIDGNDATMLIRIEVQDTLACWRARADMETLTLNAESIEPVLLPEKWEHKVGWSTNTVKISDNEYLVGWHAVLKDNLSYKNGLALVDKDGKLLAISDYLLFPTGLNEEYGDRAMVIFGDGLVLYNDYLLWIGGVSDYCIGIFIARLEDVMKELKPYSNH
ncbi:MULTISPECIES: glycosidase PH1107-related [Kosmotoga]|uniref:Glycosidase PH1107-related n=1 Tax=Kosmotoga olearia (strain ATCC BAA-1733 / DSM 21960 / TBF 19.5.1) TaxID=521045 RepID=C5CH22_KOSOT|nr:MULTISPECIES: glycosidase PH1107-related [Kosmotoga]ACR79687.1 glycosidase PH1107-related [Kosmotoga olearia TBF 19.5.1]